TLSSGGTNYNIPFSVGPSSAAIVGVSPTSGAQGASVTISVAGRGTHWQQGTTTASFAGGGGCPVPTIDVVTIVSATSATLHLTTRAGACVGAQSFQRATGGEIVGGSFSVYGSSPSLIISPAIAKAGTSVTVNFLGEFSHFNNATVPVIDGTGVS